MNDSVTGIYGRDRNGREVLNPVIVYILAAACGITVANLYWAQPLLDTIAKTYGASPSTAGMIVTFTQIGYALGLIFLVPLGDLLERKRLVLSILLITAAVLVIAAISPTIDFFITSSLIIGITSVVAQVLVPFAASLAKDHERGKVVGQVMSGLLIGILLARTMAGFISQFAGWRFVFWTASVLILITVSVLQKYLPAFRLSININYPQLLGTVYSLFKEEKLLRRRSVYGALVFAMFSVLWTSLTFLLAGSSYNFSDAVIGLFGLIGASGALSANIAGRLADKGKENISTISFLILNLFAFILMLFGGTNLLLLITGIVILDAGVQGTHITNQSIVYRLNPEARSRITTVYMASFFIGGSIGSASSALCYENWGWPGVCWLGILYAIFSIVFWMFDSRKYYRPLQIKVLPHPVNKKRQIGNLK